MTVSLLEVEDVEIGREEEKVLGEEETCGGLRTYPAHTDRHSSGRESVSSCVFRTVIQSTPVRKCDPHEHAWLCSLPS